VLKHIVAWKILKNGTQEERVESTKIFREKIEYLKTIIPELEEAVVGFNIAEGDVFHVCIDSRFKDEKSLESYLVHPEHLKVREYMNEIAFDKMIFDYYED
jgi:hypothetical protein